MIGNQSPVHPTPEEPPLCHNATYERGRHQGGETGPPEVE
jgi:hypothetical protein